MNFLTTVGKEIFLSKLEICRFYNSFTFIYFFNSKGVLDRCFYTRIKHDVFQRKQIFKQEIKNFILYPYVRWLKSEGCLLVSRDQEETAFTFGMKFTSSSGERTINFLPAEWSYVNRSILTYPPPAGKIILDSDVSNVGLGIVPSQIKGGQETVISYFSRPLSKLEMNYSVTRRELLVIVESQWSPPSTSIITSMVRNSCWQTMHISRIRF